MCSSVSRLGAEDGELSDRAGGERGFTLVELMIAAGIGVIVVGALLTMTQSVFAGASKLTDHRRAYVQIQHALDTWDHESQSALAVFVPSSDVTGVSNADGHEVDFYTRDGLRQSHFWAYRYDAAAKSVQRYTYRVPGAPPVASGAAWAGISAFSARKTKASRLRVPTLNGYSPRDVTVNFGYPGVDGGNAIVAVRIANPVADRTIDLLPGSFPSGFTVVVGTFTPPPTPAPVRIDCSGAAWWTWDNNAGYVPGYQNNLSQWGVRNAGGSVQACPLPTPPPQKSCASDAHWYGYVNGGWNTSPNGDSWWVGFTNYGYPTDFSDPNGFVKCPYGVQYTETCDRSLDGRQFTDSNGQVHQYSYNYAGSCNTPPPVIAAATPAPAPTVDTSIEYRCTDPPLTYGTLLGFDGPRGIAANGQPCNGRPPTTPPPQPGCTVNCGTPSTATPPAPAIQSPTPAPTPAQQQSCRASDGSIIYYGYNEALPTQCRGLTNLAVEVRWVRTVTVCQGPDCSAIGEQSATSPGSIGPDGILHTCNHSGTATGGSVSGGKSSVRYSTASIESVSPAASYSDVRFDIGACARLSWS